MQYQQQINKELPIQNANHKAAHIPVGCLQVGNIVVTSALGGNYVEEIRTRRWVKKKIIQLTLYDLRVRTVGTNVFLVQDKNFTKVVGFVRQVNNGV